MGTYNAQVMNTNFLNVLQNVNTTAGNTGATGTGGTSGGGGATGGGATGGGTTGGGTTGGGTTGGGTTGGGTTGGGTTGGGTTGGGTTGGGTTGGGYPSNTPMAPSAITGGFGGNTSSLAGSVPGLGRFYFDGNGNIIGVQTASNGSTISANVGAYTVNTDCTAKLTLSGGMSFDAVLVNRGKQVLFMETDSNGSGAVGQLEQAQACVSYSQPSSLGFSFFGATQQAVTSGTAAGATGATVNPAVQFRPYSAIGTISTDGNGNFVLSQTVSQAGAISRQTAQGTYSIGLDCSLQLNFSSAAAATTGGFKPPILFRGLVVDVTGGIVAIQPTGSDALTGALLVQ